jgi:flagellar biosynthesis protein FlhF
MKVKKYVVTDMKEAIRLIKGDLGPEAVIISTRKVRRRGWWGWLGQNQLEVTAAVDDYHDLRGQRGTGAPAVAGQNLGVNLNEVLPNNERLYRRIPAPPGVPVVSHAENLVKQKAVEPSPGEIGLRHDLAEVKALLRQVVKSNGEKTPGDHLLLRWRQVLVEKDVEEDIVEELMEELRTRIEPENFEGDDRATFLLVDKVARMLEPVCGDSEHLHRVIAFVGPTGVGKTTTLAKLAAQMTLFEKKKVALVTIDTYRIGAVEQLRTYGEIIGVPLEVVVTLEDLQQALKRQNDSDFILIDTAGRPSKNLRQVLELKRFLEVIQEPKDIFLVLSSTTKNRDLLKIAEDFKKLHFNKLIFTKIDETDSLGCLLNIPYRLRMPVVYLTDGQSVPDDIDRAYPKKIAKLLIKGVERYEGSGG